MSSECQIIIPYDLSMHWIADLNLLYRPIAGAQACLVYEFLISLGELGKQADPDDLKALSGCSDAMLEAALSKLEELMLVHTFEEEDHAVCAIEVVPPKKQEAFLADPLLGRLFFEAVGEEGMERLTRLRHPVMRKGKMRNITARIETNVLETVWTPQKEEAMKEYVQDWHDVDAYPFNWNEFFQGMHNAIPTRVRSRENMSRIAHLANLYGIDEKSMRVFVVRHLREKKSWIDFDAIVSDLEKTRKIGSGNPDDFMQSPITFLKSRQPDNADILPSERKLLASLVEEKQLPNEVINTLIEHCMKKNDGGFHAGFVRTLANNMLRAKVTTRQACLEQLEQSDVPAKARRKYKTKREKEKLPEWYDKIPEEKSTDADIEEIMRLQQAILGGESDAEDKT